MSSHWSPARPIKRKRSNPSTPTPEPSSAKRRNRTTMSSPSFESKSAAHRRRSRWESDIIQIQGRDSARTYNLHTALLKLKVSDDDGFDIFAHLQQSEPGGTPGGGVWRFPLADDDMVFGFVEWAYTGRFPSNSNNNAAHEAWVMANGGGEGGGGGGGRGAAGGGGGRRGGGRGRAPRDPSKHKPNYRLLAYARLFMFATDYRIGALKAMAKSKTEDYLELDDRCSRSGRSAEREAEGILETICHAFRTEMPVE
ncbi:MAG: hypothetical protein M1819_004336 [Sarea resinae]|nr:MAG: hypothetical protein M1819_004336 [Sarea resinae]